MILGGEVINFQYIICDNSSFYCEHWNDVTYKPCTPERVSTHSHSQSVSWDFRAIVLSTGAIRDSDVKWGQAADLPVFTSSVGKPSDSSVPQSDQSQHPAVDGDVWGCHCGNSNLSAAGLCLSISDRLRTELIWAQQSVCVCGDRGVCV